MEAIKTTHLTKVFDDLRAVDNLNFSVSEGEIFGLVGPDGSGKTTTMRLLTAIMDPTSGDAWVMGRHIVREAEAIKEEIGYMSQCFGLYPDLTVAENIHFYADIYGVPRRGRDQKIDGLLSFSNLTPFKKRLAGNLSGGMKQKLGVGRKDQSPHRLYESEVLALRRFDRRGEHQLLQWYLPHRSREKEGAEGVGDRNGRPQGASAFSDGHFVWRMEATAGSGVCDPS